MKRFLVFILSMIYMTASSGVVLNVHYCMGKMASSGVEKWGDNLCKCGMKTSSKGCCRNEVKVVKMTNLHKQSVVPSYAFTPLAPVSRQLLLTDLLETCTSGVKVAMESRPPDLADNHLYITNCVFRI